MFLCETEHVEFSFSARACAGRVGSGWNGAAEGVVKTHVDGRSRDLLENLGLLLAFRPRLQHAPQRIGTQALMIRRHFHLFETEVQELSEDAGVDGRFDEDWIPVVEQGLESLE